MKSSNAAITDISADGTRTAWTAKDLEALMPLVAECVPTLKPGALGFKAFLDSKGDSLTPVEKQRATFLLERILSGAAGPRDAHYIMTQQTGRLAEGYDQLIVGGYNSLLDKLSEGLDIKLNMPVTSIEYKSEDKKVSVTCKDGSEIIADYVICSVPLGVLKADTIKFVPPVPKRRQDAINNLAMGGFEKVILVWKEDDHFYKNWKENLDEVSILE